MMNRTTFAAAAILGTVMTAPAHAIVDSKPEVTFTGLGFSAATAYYNAWIAAWEPQFTVPKIVTTAFPFEYVTFFEGPHIVTFTTAFSNAGLTVKFGMPVPGPIAGAGLPLLAAGIAFAAWRRRRAANAA